MKRSILSLGIIFLFIISILTPIVISNNIKTSSEVPSESTGDSGLMNSSWPMYCNDTRHTGRSPYSTVDNPGLVKCKFNLVDAVKCSPVIDDNGTIYIGSFDDYLYALYPNNGTMKWKYGAGTETNPSIASDGTIYIGSNKVLWCRYRTVHMGFSCKVNHSVEVKFIE